MSLKATFGNAVKWIAIGNMSSQIMRWVVTFWVIRILTPEDYGTVAIAGLLEGLLFILSQQGLISPLIQKKNISLAEKKEYFGTIITTHLIFFAILQVAAQPIATIYGNPIIEDVIKISSISFIILIFDVLPTAKLTKAMDFKTLSVIAFLSNTFAALTTLILALKGFGVWSIIYGQVSKDLFSTILKNFAIFTIIPPSFGFQKSKGLLKFGVLMSLNSLVAYIVLSIDVAIGGIQLTTTELGIYAVALQVSLIPLKKIGPMIKQAIFPLISSIQDDLNRVINISIKLQRISMIIMFPIFWGISATADLFVPLILGDKWLSAILPIQIITLVIPLRFSAEVYSACIKGLGLGKLMLKNSLINLTVMLPSIIIGMNFGASGLATAWLAGYSIAYIIVLNRYKVALKSSFSDLVSPLKVPLIACSGMYAIVILCKFALIDFNALFTLLVVIITASIYYSLAIFLFDKPAINEIKSLKKKTT
ncbi:MAG: oligosaccharide flippase family protein [Colwellia sp.]|nr:oligosaccharide flippase family protein [Colwellia sp.]